MSMGRIICPLRCLFLFMVWTELIRFKKKFCRNKAKHLENVYDLKPSQLPLPLTKS